MTPHACNVHASMKIGDLKFEFLREYEAEFKKALALESGVQDDEKIEGRKCHDTVLQLNR
jgi:hypothetical protein